MKNTRFHNLVQFFGAYFHQDWDADDPTPEAVIRRFVTTNELEAVRKVVGELDDLLSLPLSEAELRRLLLDDLLCCYLPPDGRSVRTWLTWVRDSQTTKLL